VDPVGRDDVLVDLRNAVERLRAGRGGVVHVCGEAGIGKTTMLAHARAWLGDLPFRQAASDPFDVARPRRLIGRLVPERPEADDLIASTLACLEHLARTGPCAVLVEDVHWADPESLEVLTAIARRADDLSILQLSTGRPDGLTALYEHAVDRFGTRLELRPLTEDDVGTIARRRLGHQPGPQLRALLRDASGNPFLVTELLDALSDQGDLVHTAGMVELAGPVSLPERLVDRLVRRTIAVGGDDGLVARTIAVVATELNADEIAAVLARPLPSVIESLIALSSGGVLAEGGSSPAFRHDLIRRAVYDATPRSVIQALNRRTLTVLGPAAPVHRVGSCLLAAADPARPADLARLIDLGSALGASEPHLAVPLLTQALPWTPVTDPRSLTVARNLARALIDTGRAREALTVLDERLAAVPPPHPVTIHLVRVRALSMTGNLRSALAPHSEDAAAHVLDRCELDDPHAADAMAELALLYCAGGRPGQAAGLLDWLTGHPGDRSRYGRAHEYTAKAWVHAIAGRFADSVTESGLGAAVLEGDCSRSAAAARPVLVRAIMLDNLGRGDEALRTLRTGQLAPGPRWNQLLLQFATTLLLYRHGDWDDALAEAEAGLVAAEETGFSIAVCWPFAMSAAIAALRGNHDDAGRQLAAAATRVTPLSLGAELLGYATAITEETAGRPDAAATTLAVTARAVLRLPAPGLLVNFGVDTVRLNRTRDVDAAAQVSAELDRLATLSPSPVVAALAAWSGGLLTADADRLAWAASQLSACGRRPQAARACHDAAVTAAASGRTERVRDLAAMAFTAYDALGAEYLHRRLGAELREAGLRMRPRRGAVRPRAGWDSLTDTERGVVALVADGLTNGEIARRLVVSRRTVESHLARIYPKVDVHSRGELVAAMARRADSPDPVA
jgi:DNA-binding CsgD family transcriptional regulator